MRFAKLLAFTTLLAASQSLPTPEPNPTPSQVPAALSGHVSPVPLERRFKCSITLGYCYELMADELSDAGNATIARRSPSGDSLERRLKCSITLGYCYQFDDADHGPENTTDISKAKRSKTTGEPLVRRLECSITLGYCYGLADDSLPTDQPNSSEITGQPEVKVVEGLNRHTLRAESVV